MANGSALPLTLTGSGPSKSNRARVARQVGSPTTAPFTGATLWSLAAVLTTSPDHGLGLLAGRQGRSGPAPVAIPMRTVSESDGVTAFSSLDGVQDPQGAAHGPLRIVLVGDRRAKDAP